MKIIAGLLSTHCSYSRQKYHNNEVSYVKIILQSQLAIHNRDHAFLTAWRLMA